MFYVFYLIGRKITWDACSESCRGSMCGYIYVWRNDKEFLGSTQDEMIVDYENLGSESNAIDDSINSANSCDKYDGSMLLSENDKSSNVELFKTNRKTEKSTSASSISREKKTKSLKICSTQNKENTQKDKRSPSSKKYRTDKSFKLATLARVTSHMQRIQRLYFRVSV